MQKKEKIKKFCAWLSFLSSPCSLQVYVCLPIDVSSHASPQIPRSLPLTTLIFPVYKFGGPVACWASASYQPSSPLI